MSRTDDFDEFFKDLKKVVEWSDYFIKKNKDREGFAGKDWKEIKALLEVVKYKAEGTY